MPDSLRMRSSIAAKWQSDCQLLPLTPRHKELYYYIHRAFWRDLGKFPDLVNCHDLNEKVQWLKLFDQSREIVQCADKVLVRDYVKNRIGEKYLVTLYQHHEHFNQIDFDALPESFVIKTNNDSGSVFPVKDRSTFDRDSAEKLIEKALTRPYGWKSGEWVYSYIKPKVLVEQHIDPDSEAPPPDYKIYCVDGNARFCHYIYDRGIDTKEQTIDPQGNDLATPVWPKYKLGKGFTRPNKWDEMIGTAEKLASGHKFVRVDMYCPDDAVYFGEMTFWPHGGRCKGPGQEVLGEYLDFDRSTYKPFIIHELGIRPNRFDFYLAKPSRIFERIFK